MSMVLLLSHKGLIANVKLHFVPCLLGTIQKAKHHHQKESRCKGGWGGAKDSFILFQRAQWRWLTNRYKPTYSVYIMFNMAGKYC